MRFCVSVDGVPTQLFATDSSVVAVIGRDPITTFVFDATTGARRFNPIAGRAYPMGTAGALLLVAPPDDAPMRLVKTRDGSLIAPWEQLPGMAGASKLRASATRPSSC